MSIVKEICSSCIHLKCHLRGSPGIVGCENHSK
jgi:hypothetical protein